MDAHSAIARKHKNNRIRIWPPDGDRIGSTDLCAGLKGEPKQLPFTALIVEGQCSFSPASVGCDSINRRRHSGFALSLKTHAYPFKVRNLTLLDELAQTLNNGLSRLTL